MERFTLEEIKLKMAEKFGFQNFKSSWQEDAVMKIYEGHKNVIVSLPTHGGKSLTFQIQSKKLFIVNSQETNLFVIRFIEER